ncbi:protein FIP1-like [Nymphaea colorata]|nr:protein FIP1-like [Nymphaea colorata]XP_031497727.1 protein FIP1-like [Nymphaea colorata]
MSQERSRRPAGSSANDDDNLFIDLLNGSRLTSHRQPISIVGGVIYCVLLTGYAIVAAAAPWIFYAVPKLKLSLLCSCSVVLLIVTGIFQQYLVFQVRKLQLQGYFTFSQKLRPVVRLPFVSTSFGTALMLLVMSWQQFINVPFLSISTSLRIIMFVEVICAGSFMSLYIGCVHQYNSLNGQPDVLKFFYSSLQPSNALEEMRYHDGDRLSDQHMALLQYQQENLHYLSEEILRLQECLSKYEQSGDGNNTSVDLAHLLAARDQELRSLSAEMNQVQSELHLARDLIAERDSEVQRIRAMNSQYVEENERLRAILGEWSARAAKLERALEAERLPNMELQKKIPKARHPPSQSSERNED